MSSFRKRQVQEPIPGTLTSPQTGQIITSSGNPSLDALFGGGLPIGSICLIEEDKYVTYSRVLSKYFLAEGILAGHNCFVGSLDEDPNDILKKLPKPFISSLNEENNEETDANGLRIAWRYHGLPIVNSDLKAFEVDHHFNLMDHMDSSILDYVNIISWNDKMGENENCVDDEDEVKNHFDNANDTTENNDASKEENENQVEAPSNQITEEPMDFKECSKVEDGIVFHNPKYTRILQKLQPLLRSHRFNDGERRRYLCRVCITSLGSPMWYDDKFAKDILKFLTVLRSMIRNTVSVCFITMPLNIISKIDKNLVHKIRNLVDYAIELESFAGSDKEKNHAYKEYNGFLQLRKIAAINSLSAYLPETTDLAFKLRRKKFVIEKLHLPPELQENSDAGKKSSELLMGASCGSQSTGPSKVNLEF